MIAIISYLFHEIILQQQQKLYTIASEYGALWRIDYIVCSIVNRKQMECIRVYAVHTQNTLISLCGLESLLTFNI